MLVFNLGLLRLWHWQSHSLTTRLILIHTRFNLTHCRRLNLIHFYNSGRQIRRAFRNIRRTLPEIISVLVLFTLRQRGWRAFYYVPFAYKFIDFIYAQKRSTIRKYSIPFKAFQRQWWMGVGPCAGVDYTLALCPLQSRLQLMYHGQP
jgi:hypothetical protein